MIKFKQIVFWVITFFVVIMAVIIILLFKPKSISPNLSPGPGPVITTDPISTATTSQAIIALFTCSSGQTIRASFYNGAKPIVDLSLSDGRTMQVPQAISASGARYASADELFVFWNKGNTAFIEENGTTTFADCLAGDSVSTTTIDVPTSLANPASVNCEKQGGGLQMATRSDGGQYGLCYFEDNRACEEWAMMRGDCPVGGVKTTGYDTEAQKYCAWSGGQTIAAPNAICTFKDGSTCAADAFYAGICQPGEKIK